jgi:K+/H+ antiporter YhaU regulatory subunit KhtT
MDLYKLPGVAETVDWARSLAALGSDGSDAEAVESTMGAAVKYQEDLETVRQAIPDLMRDRSA